MNKLTNSIVKLLSIFCVIVITGLTLIVFIQVFSRFIKYSIPGTEELARLLIVWLTFLGSSLAIYEKMHLGVRYFVGLVSINKQKKIDFFIHILMILFFSVLVFYGFKLTMSTVATTSPALQISMAIFYGVIPISSLFSIYFIIVNMINPSHSRQGEATL
ncbi:TRAP transporter small permease [Sporosarcina sp. G11-34]|uniref:TRAP transporter small permease n=1 Tax=Sporosarcina sp. G11-34 TaxID=2849605 RepID=UPI0022A9D581|nr:TRAP transporter small permease [Sporosarcina sp. G11-34]